MSEVANREVEGLSCFHCGVETNSDAAIVSADRTFCSDECRQATAQIHKLDLDDYYTYRERFGAAEQPCCKQQSMTSAFGEDNVDGRKLEFARVDRSIGGNRRQVSLHIPDIRCAACTWLIESSLAKRDDVTRCQTILADRVVAVEYEGEDPLAIVTYIESLGFTPLPDRGADVREAQVRERKQMTIRLGLAGIGMMQVMMYAIATYVAGDDGIEPAYRSLMHWASLAMTTPIVLYSAMPFHRGALRDLTNRTLGMDVPVSLAICSAFVLSVYSTLTGSGHVYFDSVAMFTFLLLLGRFVEMRSRQRFESSRLLADSLLPAAARLEVDDKPVDITQITEGMRLRVAAGERITADGIIIEGETSVDESAFTGESMPLEKGSGSRVLAGAMNQDDSIVIEASVDFEEFVINRISAMYRDAAAWRPQFATTADVIARYFVAGVLLLATASGIGWTLAGGDGFRVALTVLVVSCPCALSLATPVAYTVALSALRRAGVVIRNGRFLERLSGVTHVVFDKTGTLTRGKLGLEHILVVRDMSEEQACRLAAGLERDSKHPIASAFERFAAVAATDIETVPGRGVEGTMDGVRYRLGQPAYAAPSAAMPDGGDFRFSGMWIVLSDSNGPVAWFALRDEIRPESTPVTAWLGKALTLSMFTGDPSAEGRRIASTLGIADARVGMSPTDKIEAVRELEKNGEVVLMIGDGINDAGSMSAADASLAVSPADVLVQDAADATLLSANLESVPMLVIYAQRVRRIVRQNVVWAVGYNLSVIPLAVAGVITPWMAAIGMSVSSLLVVLNANRLSEVRAWK